MTEEAAAITREQWSALAGAIHTPESFGRTVLSRAFDIASRSPDKVAPDGSITLKGTLTIKPSITSEKARRSFFRTCVTICWEDEGRQQSVCETVCYDEVLPR